MYTEAHTSIHDKCTSLAPSDIHQSSSAEPITLKAEFLSVEETPNKRGERDVGHMVSTVVRFFGVRVLYYIVGPWPI